MTKGDEIPVWVGRGVSRSRVPMDPGDLGTGMGFQGVFPLHKYLVFVPPALILRECTAHTEFPSFHLFKFPSGILWFPKFHLGGKNLGGR